jgi:hypothetical protein
MPRLRTALLTAAVALAACDPGARRGRDALEERDLADTESDGADPTTGAAVGDNDSDTDEQWVQLVSPQGQSASGVWYREIAGASGSDIFVGYAGYSVQQAWANAWVDALFEARLAEMGVRHLVAVRGPAQAGYQGREIGNSKLARTLTAWLADETETDADTRVIVAAHSSGSFVAHELFGQLTTGLDPDGLTADRIWYFDLDGARSGLNAAITSHLRRAYFVYAVQHRNGATSYSQNRSSMLAADGVYGEAMAISADHSGCNVGAGWCLHDALINTRPHSPTTFALQADYTDFADAGIGRAVAVEYLDRASWE